METRQAPSTQVAFLDIVNAHVKKEKNITWIVNLNIFKFEAA